MTTVERSLQYRSFWRRLDGTLGTIAAQRDVMTTLDAILKTILRDYRDDLNLVAGRLYEKLDEPERYVLRRWYGPNPPDRIGYTVPITYQAVALLLERGLLVMKESDPGFDRSIEDPLGVSAFAALTESKRGLVGATCSSVFRSSDQNSLLPSLPRTSL